MKIAFLGDISLNNRYDTNKTKSYFSEIGGKISVTDLVIANLECLAFGKAFNPLKKPRLGTHESSFDYLTQIGVGMVTLAHNHVYDNLIDGFTNSTDKLSELNIDFFGASASKEDWYQPKIIEKDGVKVGFLNFVTTDTNPSLPQDHKIFLNTYEDSLAKKQIADLKRQVDQLVLLMHWGGKHEGASYPDYEQRKKAKRLVDYGADLIVGHHSHTIQPYEWIKGKLVFYSIGNFCFDNIVSDGITRYLDKKRKTGAILNVNFKKSSYDFEPLFIRNRKLNIVPAGRGTAIRFWFRQRIFNLFKDSKLFFKIVFFSLKKIYPFYYFFLVDKSTMKEKSQKVMKKFSSKA